MKKVLFILKKNEVYSFVSYTRRSSGLWNSTRFIVESLKERGVEAEIVEVIDNNEIDREVTRFRPDLVIIEALWVVPEKFPVLMKLHPDVTWVCHLHSHMPFLALEGIAMEWIVKYADLGVGLIANSKPSYEALRCILDDDEILYIPNVYLGEFHKPLSIPPVDVGSIDIGCFGAVRPLKNQLIQALAAIRFAKEKGQYLRFHINGSRIETGGDPVMKNIRTLFELTPDAVLVESKWNEPEEFLYLLRHMDLGMQVSLTETFNVVCADYVTAGIPVVASKEVAWLTECCKAKDDSVDSIVERMHAVWQRKFIVRANQRALARFSRRAQKMWYIFVTEALEIQTEF